MSRRILALLAALVGLTACEPSGDIDLETLERENREVLRQLGGE